MEVHTTSLSEGANVMTYGFRKLPTDTAFARRSAEYLAQQGLNSDAISTSLRNELQLCDTDIDSIVSELAAA